MKKLFCLICLLGFIQEAGWAQNTLKEALQRPDSVEQLRIGGDVIIPPEISKLKRVKYVKLFKRSIKLEFPKALLTLDSLQQLDLWLILGRGPFRIPREVAQMKSLKKIKIRDDDALNIEYPREIKQRKDLVIEDKNRYTYLRAVVGYQQGIGPQGDGAVMELGLMMRRGLPYIFEGNPMDEGIQFNPAFWSWSIVWEKYLQRAMEGYRFMFGNSFVKLGSIYYRNPKEAASGFFAYRVELGINAGDMNLTLGYNIASGHHKINRLMFNFRANIKALVLKKRKYY